MGNDLSSSFESGGVDIMGQDNTIQDLQPEEIQILKDSQDAFYKFYTNPVENFKIINNHKNLYSKAFGQNFDLYQWIIEKKFSELKEVSRILAQVINDFYNPKEDTSLKTLNESVETSDSDFYLDYELEVDRLLDPRNFLSVQDLSKLWILYYATGDKTFSNRIKNMARNPLVNENIRASAISTYTTNIKNGYITDNDWSC